MKTDTIIKLGMALGLPFNRKDNFEHQLAKNIVVFNGANNQRFLIDGSNKTAKIHRDLGIALIQMGMRLKAIHMENVMSTTSDTTDLPYWLDNE